MLDGFYRADLGEIFGSANKTEWADVLEDLGAEAIHKACIDYHQNGPKSKVGKLVKPAPGDIYQRAKKFVPRPAFVKANTETEKPNVARVTAKRCLEIAAEVGWGLTGQRSIEVPDKKRVDDYNA